MSIRREVDRLRKSFKEMPVDSAAVVEALRRLRHGEYVPDTEAGARARRIWAACAEIFFPGDWDENGQELPGCKPDRDFLLMMAEMRATGKTLAEYLHDSPARAIP